MDSRVAARVPKRASVKASPTQLPALSANQLADMYQRRRAQGLSKIEASRQAQLALMAQPKCAHPFYWAPFILMGNWK